MAMSGIRDLSIIATPPAKRLSVKTFVRQHDEQLIKEAVLRELLRGGQAYCLHNEVSSIEKAAEDLQALIPEARIGIGHGQMREHNRLILYKRIVAAGSDNDLKSLQVVKYSGASGAMEQPEQRFTTVESLLQKLTG